MQAIIVIDVGRQTNRDPCSLETRKNYVEVDVLPYVTNLSYFVQPELRVDWAQSVMAAEQSADVALHLRRPHLRVSCYGGYWRALSASKHSVHRHSCAQIRYHKIA